MRRVILFLVLLSLGIGLLVILAERQGGDFVGHSELPETTRSVLPPEASSAQTYMKKLHVTQMRAAEPGSSIAAVPESEIWAEEAFDQGNGYWILKTMKVRLLQEKNPEAETFLLNAKQGLVGLSGSFGEMAMDSTKPVHFEDVVADFYDARGDFPPLRVKAPQLEGQMQERRFWTEGPFTIGQPGSEDFEGSGVGLEGDAKSGSVVMKKDPRIRYWVRSAPGAPVDRELRLRCDGPLKIERADSSRLAQANGNAVLEVEEKRSGSLQKVRADRLLAWTRTDRADHIVEPKKRVPIAFERVEASGNVRIDTAQALLFGKKAEAAIGASGRIDALELRGSPRAAFSAASAGALTQASAGQSQSIFVQCEGPLEFAQSSENEGEMRMRFERNVLLFGAGPLAHLPSRFGEQLELQFEKLPPAAESTESSFRILAGAADGGVAWRGGGATIFAPTMRMKPSAQGAMQIAFSPSPLLETRFASAALSPGEASAPPARTLWLFAKQRLVQRAASGAEGASEATLEGLVWGRVCGGKNAPAGELQSNGLRVLTPRPGTTQLAAEHGFFYEEGANGLRLKAERVEPFGEQGMRLVGAPAEFRQPSEQGKPLELAASAIAFDPITGEFRAQGDASAKLPQDSGEVLQLECQVLEGARGEGAQPLRRLEAFQQVKLHSQGQDAGGESLQVDFAEKVHRIFGTDENPAWIAGPMDQGRFSAKSRRIEIRDGGSSIRLAPGATVEILGKAMNFGPLTPASAGGASKNDGIRIFPKGESRIEKELVTFSGGVRLETLAPAASGGSTLLCRELLLHRDPATGELLEMEAREEVKYRSEEFTASGTEMHLWPKTNELLLLGDERQPAALQFPSQQVAYSSTRIQYNLVTHLIKTGAGVATPR